MTVCAGEREREKKEETNEYKQFVVLERRFIAPFIVLNHSPLSSVLLSVRCPFIRLSTDSPSLIPSFFRFPFIYVATYTHTHLFQMAGEKIINFKLDAQTMERLTKQKSLHVAYRKSGVLVRSF